MSFRVALDVYEGPVELLLYLIRRDELDIYAIPIGRITDEFLGYIRALHELDLDAAADFLVVATVLVRLKIRTLLPRPQADDGESAGVTSLADILAELARYKKAASLLSTMETERRQLFPRPGVEPDAVVVEETGNLYELAMAFQMICRRAVEDEALVVNMPVVRLDDKMAQLREIVGREGKAVFSGVLRSCRSVQEMVVVFIAILELVRLGEIWLRQEGAFGDIVFRRRQKPLNEYF